MNGIWYYAIAFILIWVVCLTFKRKLENSGFEIDFPIIMWKTQKLLGFIEKLANISPRFWKWFMNVGIVVSFAFMIFMAYALIQSLSTIASTPSVAILLPGVEMPGSPIFIPFIQGFIALITVIVVHEFSHGIMAIVEKINIKSIGLLLFAILPGAFVEPDEEGMKKLNILGRLRIYAAGSTANLSLALVSVLIVLFISTVAVPQFFYEDGIEITNVVEDAPAFGILKEGMIVKSINNVNVSSSENYLNALSTLKPNETVSITTDTGTYNLELTTNPDNNSRGFIGIQGGKHFDLKDNSLGNQIPWIFFTLAELFQWIFLLNFAIGTFNLLPMKPLDGGHMLENLLNYKFSEDITKPIVKFLTILFWLIILFSLIYSMSMALL